MTGGFHTPEIAQLLKDQKQSYIVVTPKITKVDIEGASSYLSVFAQEKTPLEKLFSGQKLFVNPTNQNLNPRTNAHMWGFMMLPSLREAVPIPNTPDVFVAADIPNGYQLVEPLMDVGLGTGFLITPSAPVAAVSDWLPYAFLGFGLVLAAVVALYYRYLWIREQKKPPPASKVQEEDELADTIKTEEERSSGEEIPEEEKPFIFYSIAVNLAGGLIRWAGSQHDAVQWLNDNARAIDSTPGLTKRMTESDRIFSDLLNQANRQRYRFTNVNDLRRIKQAANQIVRNYHRHKKIKGTRVNDIKNDSPPHKGKIKKFALINAGGSSFLIVRDGDRLNIYRHAKDFSKFEHHVGFIKFNERIRFGRRIEGNDVSIKDPAMSGRHFELIARPIGDGSEFELTVIDNASINGTDVLMDFNPFNPETPPLTDFSTRWFLQKLFGFEGGEAHPIQELVIRIAAVFNPIEIITLAIPLLPILTHRDQYGWTGSRTIGHVLIILATWIPIYFDAYGWALAGNILTHLVYNVISWVAGYAPLVPRRAPVRLQRKYFMGHGLPFENVGKVLSDLTLLSKEQLLLQGRQAQSGAGGNTFGNLNMEEFALSIDFKWMIERNIEGAEDLKNIVNSDPLPSDVLGLYLSLTYGNLNDEYIPLVTKVLSEAYKQYREEGVNLYVPGIDDESVFFRWGFIDSKYSNELDDPLNSDSRQAGIFVPLRDLPQLNLIPNEFDGNLDEYKIEDRVDVRNGVFIVAVKDQASENQARNEIRSQLQELNLTPQEIKNRMGRLIFIQQPNGIDIGRAADTLFTPEGKPDFRHIQENIQQANQDLDPLTDVSTRTLLQKLFGLEGGKAHPIQELVIRIAAVFNPIEIITLAIPFLPILTHRDQYGWTWSRTIGHGLIILATWIPIYFDAYGWALAGNIIIHLVYNVISWVMNYAPLTQSTVGSFFTGIGLLFPSISGEENKNDDEFPQEYEKYQSVLTGPIHNTDDLKLAFEFIRLVSPDFGGAIIDRVLKENIPVVMADPNGSYATKSLYSLLNREAAWASVINIRPGGSIAEVLHEFIHATPIHELPQPLNQVKNIRVNTEDSIEDIEQTLTQIGYLEEAVSMTGEILFYESLEKNGLAEFAKPDNIYKERIEELRPAFEEAGRQPDAFAISIPRIFNVYKEQFEKFGKENAEFMKMPIGELMNIPWGTHLGEMGIKITRTADGARLIEVDPSKILNAVNIIPNLAGKQMDTALNAAKDWWNKKQQSSSNITPPIDIDDLDFPVLPLKPVPDADQVIENQPAQTVNRVQVAGRFVEKLDLTIDENGGLSEDTFHAALNAATHLDAEKSAALWPQIFTVAKKTLKERPGRMKNLGEALLKRGYTKQGEYVLNIYTAAVIDGLSFWNEIGDIVIFMAENEQTELIDRLINQILKKIDKFKDGVDKDGLLEFIESIGDFRDSDESEVYRRRIEQDDIKWIFRSLQSANYHSTFSSRYVDDYVYTQDRVDAHALASLYSLATKLYSAAEELEASHPDKSTVLKKLSERIFKLSEKGSVDFFHARIAAWEEHLDIRYDGDIDSFAQQWVNPPNSGSSPSFEDHAFVRYIQFHAKALMNTSGLTPQLIAYLNSIPKGRYKARLYEELSHNINDNHPTELIDQFTQDWEKAIIEIQPLEDIEADNRSKVHQEILVNAGGEVANYLEQYEKDYNLNLDDHSTLRNFYSRFLPGDLTHSSISDFRFSVRSALYKDPSLAEQMLSASQVLPFRERYVVRRAMLYSFESFGEGLSIQEFVQQLESDFNAILTLAGIDDQIELDHFAKDYKDSPLIQGQRLSLAKTRVQFGSKHEKTKGREEFKNWKISQPIIFWPHKLHQRYSEYLFEDWGRSERTTFFPAILYLQNLIEVIELDSDNKGAYSEKIIALLDQVQFRNGDTEDQTSIKILVLVRAAESLAKHGHSEVAKDASNRASFMARKRLDDLEIELQKAAESNQSTHDAEMEITYTQLWKADLELRHRVQLAQNGLGNNLNELLEAVQKDVVERRNKYTAAAIFKAAGILEEDPQHQSMAIELYELGIEKLALTRGDHAHFNLASKILFEKMRMGALPIETRDELLLKAIQAIVPPEGERSFTALAGVNNELGPLMTNIIKDKKYPRSEKQILEYLNEAAFGYEGKSDWDRSSFLTALAKAFNTVAENNPEIMSNSSVPSLVDVGQSGTYIRSLQRIHGQAWVEHIRSHDDDFSVNTILSGILDRDSAIQILLDQVDNGQLDEIKPILIAIIEDELTSHMPLTWDEINTHPLLAGLLKRVGPQFDGNAEILDLLLSALDRKEALQRLHIYLKMLSTNTIPIEIQRRAFEGLAKAGKVSAYIQSWHRKEIMKDGKMSEGHFFQLLHRLYFSNNLSLPHDHIMAFVLDNPQREKEFFERFNHMRSKVNYWELSSSERENTELSRFLNRRQYFETSSEYENEYQSIVNKNNMWIPDLFNEIDLILAFYTDQYNTRNKVNFHAWAEGIRNTYVYNAFDVNRQWVAARQTLNNFLDKLSMILPHRSITNEEMAELLDHWGSDHRRSINVSTLIRILNLSSEEIYNELKYFEGDFHSRSVMNHFGLVEIPRDQQDQLNVFLAEIRKRFNERDQRMNDRAADIPDAFKNSPPFIQYAISTYFTKLPFGQRQAILNDFNLAGLSEEQALKKFFEVTGNEKLGQYLSVRRDLIPENIRKELREFQEDLKSSEFMEVKETIEDELGQPIDKVFSSIDEVPLNVGTIGEVYRATLLDGSQVIIKVITPTRRNAIERNLSRLKEVVDDVEANKDRLGFQVDVTGLYQEYARTMREEMDFRKENANADEFNSTLPQGVSMPTYYNQYTRRSLVVQSYVEGNKLSAVKRRTRNLVLRQLIRMLFDHILKGNVFHDDLHPGNIRVLKDGTVSLLDFGRIGRISKKEQEKIIPLYLVVKSRNANLIADKLESIGTKRINYDRDSLLASIQTHTENGHSTSDLFSSLFFEAGSHGLTIDSTYLQVLKAVSTLEGTIREIYPHVNFESEVRRYLAPGWHIFSVILGANWEIIFQLPILLALIPGLDMVAYPLWIIMALVFAKYHPSSTNRTQMFVVGLLLGAPFVFIGFFGWTTPFVNILIHSTHNLLKYLDLLPDSWDYASITQTREAWLNEAPEHLKSRIEEMERSNPTTQSLLELIREKDSSVQYLVGGKEPAMASEIDERFRSELRDEYAIDRVPQKGYFIKFGGDLKSVSQWIRVILPHELTHVVLFLYGKMTPADWRTLDNHLAEVTFNSNLYTAHQNWPFLFSNALGDYAVTQFLVENNHGQAAQDHLAWVLELGNRDAQIIKSVLAPHLKDPRRTRDLFIKYGTHYLMHYAMHLFRVQPILDTMSPRDRERFESNLYKKYEWVIELAGRPNIKAFIEEIKLRQFAEGDWFVPQYFQEKFESFYAAFHHVVKAHKIDYEQTSKPVLARVASVKDDWARENLSPFWYFLYTVFGVNWEMVYQLPILLPQLALYFYPHLAWIQALTYILWVVSAYRFNKAHKERAGRQLFIVGLLLGAPFAFAPFLSFLPWYAPFLINIAIHSGHNLLKYLDLLPDSWDYASIANTPLQEAIDKWNSDYVKSSPAEHDGHLGLLWRDTNMANGVGSIREFDSLKEIFKSIFPDQSTDLSNAPYTDENDLQIMLVHLNTLGLVNESEIQTLLDNHARLGELGEKYFRNGPNLGERANSESLDVLREEYYRHAASAFGFISVIIPSMYEVVYGAVQNSSSQSLGDSFDVRSEINLKFSTEDGFELNQEEFLYLKSDVSHLSPDLAIRAIDLSAQYGISLSPTLRHQIWSMRNDISSWVETQRISRTPSPAWQNAIDSFMNLMSQPKPIINSIWEMDQLGLLEAFVPEYRNVKYLPSNMNVHIFTVGQHTLYLMKYIDEFLESNDSNFETVRSLREELTPNQIRRLRLAILLHDLGKRPSKTATEADHAAVAAQEISPTFLRAMGLEEGPIRSINWLIRNHMIWNHHARRTQEEFTDNLLFIVETIVSDPSVRSEYLKLLYIFSLADTLSVNPWSKPWEEALQRLEQIFEEADNYQLSSEIGRSRARRDLRARANELRDQQHEGFVQENKDKIFQSVDETTFNNYIKRIHPTDLRDMVSFNDIQQFLARLESNDSLIEPFLNAFPVLYLAKKSASERAYLLLFFIHLEIVKERGSNNHIVYFSRDYNRGYEHQYEIIVGSPQKTDDAYAKMTGALLAHQFSVQGASVRSVHHDMVINRFYGFYRQSIPTEEDEINMREELSQNLTELLSSDNSKTVESIFQKKGRVYKATRTGPSNPTKVYFLRDRIVNGQEVSGVLVQTPDFDGVLHAVTTIIHQLGFTLESAPIKTHPVMANDLFFISNNQKPLTNYEKAVLQNEISKVLHQQIIQFNQIKPVKIIPPQLNGEEKIWTPALPELSPEDISALELLLKEFQKLNKRKPFADNPGLYESIINQIEEIEERAGVKFHEDYIDLTLPGEEGTFEIHPYRVPLPGKIPAVNKRIGLEQLNSILKSHLGNPDKDQIFLEISGREGTGKTTISRQIEAGALGPEINPDDILVIHTDDYLDRDTNGRVVLNLVTIKSILETPQNKDKKIIILEGTQAHNAFGTKRLALSPRADVKIRMITFGPDPSELWRRIVNRGVSRSPRHLLETARVRNIFYRYFGYDLAINDADIIINTSIDVEELVDPSTSASNFGNLIANLFISSDRLRNILFYPLLVLEIVSLSFLTQSFLTTGPPLFLLAVLFIGTHFFLRWIMAENSLLSSLSDTVVIASYMFSPTPVLPILVHLAIDTISFIREPSEEKLIKESSEELVKLKDQAGSALVKLIKQQPQEYRTEILKLILLVFTGSASSINNSYTYAELVKNKFRKRHLHLFHDLLNNHAMAGDVLNNFIRKYRSKGMKKEWITSSEMDPFDHPLAKLFHVAVQMFMNTDAKAGNAHYHTAESRKRLVAARDFLVDQVHRSAPLPHRSVRDSLVDVVQSEPDVMGTINLNQVKKGDPQEIRNGIDARLRQRNGVDDFAFIIGGTGRSIGRESNGSFDENSERYRNLVTLTQEALHVLFGMRSAGDAKKRLGNMQIKHAISYQHFGNQDPLASLMIDDLQLDNEVKTFFINNPHRFRWYMNGDFMNDVIKYFGGKKDIKFDYDKNLTTYIKHRLEVIYKYETATTIQELKEAERDLAFSYKFSKGVFLGRVKKWDSKNNTWVLIEREVIPMLHPKRNPFVVVSKDVYSIEDFIDHVNQEIKSDSRNKNNFYIYHQAITHQDRIFLLTVRNGQVELHYNSGTYSEVAGQLRFQHQEGFLTSIDSNNKIDMGWFVKPAQENAHEWSTTASNEVRKLIEQGKIFVVTERFENQKILIDLHVRLGLAVGPLGFPIRKINGQYQYGQEGDLQIDTRRISGFKFVALQLANYIGGELRDRFTSFLESEQPEPKNDLEYTFVTNTAPRDFQMDHDFLQDKVSGASNIGNLILTRLGVSQPIRNILFYPLLAFEIMGLSYLTTTLFTTGPPLILLAGAFVSAHFLLRRAIGKHSWLSSILDSAVMATYIFSPSPTFPIIFHLIIDTGWLIYAYVQYRIGYQKFHKELFPDLPPLLEGPKRLDEKQLFKLLKSFRYLDISRQLIEKERFKKAGEKLLTRLKANISKKLEKAPPPIRYTPEELEEISFQAHIEELIINPWQYSQEKRMESLKKQENLPVVWTGQETQHPIRRIERQAWKFYKDQLQFEGPKRVKKIPPTPTHNIGFGFSDITESETALGFIQIFLGPLAHYADLNSLEGVNVSDEDVRAFIAYTPYYEDFKNLSLDEQRAKIIEFIKVSQQFRAAIRSRDTFLAFLAAHNRTLSTQSQQQIKLAEELVGEVQNQVVIIDPETAFGKLILLTPLKINIFRGMAYSVSLDNEAQEKIRFAYVVEKALFSDGLDEFYTLRTLTHELLHVRYLADDYRQRGNEWIAFHEGVVEFLNRELLLKAIEVPNNPVVRRIKQEIAAIDRTLAGETYMDRVQNKYERISPYAQQYLYIKSLVPRFGRAFLTQIGHDAVWKSLKRGGASNIGNLILTWMGVSQPIRNILFYPLLAIEMLGLSYLTTTLFTTGPPLIFLAVAFVGLHWALRRVLYQNSLLISLSDSVVIASYIFSPTPIFAVLIHLAIDTYWFIKESGKTRVIIDRELNLTDQFPELKDHWGQMTNDHLNALRSLNLLVRLTNQYTRAHQFPQEALTELITGLQPYFDHDGINKMDIYWISYFIMNLGQIRNIRGETIPFSNNLIFLIAAMKSGLADDIKKDMTSVPKVVDEPLTDYSLYRLDREVERSLIITELENRIHGFRESSPHVSKYFKTVLELLNSIYDQNHIPFGQFEMNNTLIPASIMVLPGYAHLLPDGLLNNPAHYIGQQNDVPDVSNPILLGPVIKFQNWNFTMPFILGEEIDKVKHWTLNDGSRVYSKRVNPMRVRSPEEEIHLARAAQEEFNKINPNLKAQEFIGIIFDGTHFHLLSKEIVGEKISDEEESTQYEIELDQIHTVLENVGAADTEGFLRRKEIIINDHIHVIDFETLPYKVENGVLIEEDQPHALSGISSDNLYQHFMEGDLVQKGQVLFEAVGGEISRPGLTNFDLSILPFLYEVPDALLGSRPFGIQNITDEGIVYSRDGLAQESDMVWFTPTGRAIMGPYLEYLEKVYFSESFDHLDKILTLFPGRALDPGFNNNMATRGRKMIGETLDVHPNAYFSLVNGNNVELRAQLEILQALQGMLAYVPQFIQNGQEPERAFWIPHKDGIGFYDRENGDFIERVSFAQFEGADANDFRKILASMMVMKRMARFNAINELDFAAKYNTQSVSTPYDNKRREIEEKFQDQLPLLPENLSVADGMGRRAGRAVRDIITPRFTLEELNLLSKSLGTLPDFLLDEHDTYLPFIPTRLENFTQPIDQHAIFAFAPIAMRTPQMLINILRDPNIRSFVQSQSSKEIVDLSYVRIHLHEKAHRIYRSLSEENKKEWANNSWDVSSWRNNDAIAKSDDATENPDHHFLIDYPLNENNSQEDFVDHVSAYILFGPQFRDATERSEVIEAKYNFIRDTVFRGHEYHDNSIGASNIGNLILAWLGISPSIRKALFYPSLAIEMAGLSYITSTIFTTGPPLILLAVAFVGLHFILRRAFGQSSTQQSLPDSLVIATYILSPTPLFPILLHLGIDTFWVQNQNKEDLKLDAMNQLAQLAVAFAKGDEAQALLLLQDRSPIRLDFEGTQNNDFTDMGQWAQQIKENPELHAQFKETLEETFENEGIRLQDLTEERQIYLLVFLTDVGLNISPVQTDRGHVFVLSEDTVTSDVATVILKSTMDQPNTLIVPESQRDRYENLIKALSRVRGQEFKGDLLIYNDISELDSEELRSNYGERRFVVDKSLKDQFPQFMVLQDLLERLLPTPTHLLQSDQIKAIYQAVLSAA